MTAWYCCVQSAVNSTPQLCCAVSARVPHSMYPSDSEIYVNTNCMRARSAYVWHFGRRVIEIIIFICSHPAVRCDTQHYVRYTSRAATVAENHTNCTHQRGRRWRRRRHNNGRINVIVLLRSYVHVPIYAERILSHAFSRPLTRTTLHISIYIYISWCFCMRVYRNTTNWIAL